MNHHAITVRHNFETAHRLPHLGGKCTSLHGHSWWAEVRVEGPALTGDGTVVEFGAFKRGLRQWLDAHLDHGAMLGVEDPLCEALRAQGSKVCVFGAATPDGVDLGDLAWPTVENVAIAVARVATTVLCRLDAGEGSTVASVRIDETHVNSAEWTA
ncbi:6-carboxytetrahydropterin synthase [Umezawaea sp. Da 62-37]|uniref:6-pyruvoyl trahydropterin synthase family protein n=1 Tax=Umezawaea sp. Da 62-37 TaxID=3075927 RepID=UPI0028F74105|nr:6-carboxytetrahydropterin synthase [Umezawaea sp. Da 62-37]WNV87999.1 6-carboxytetrahydropterin synthase [Umezawaea sp. Da 62-37]